jgi:hypothetical protein
MPAAGMRVVVQAARGLSRWLGLRLFVEELDAEADALVAYRHARSISRGNESLDGVTALPAERALTCWLAYAGGCPFRVVSHDREPIVVADGGMRIDKGGQLWAF